MRQQVVWVTVTGLLLSMALGAGAQVSQEDKDKLKKKAEEKQSTVDKDALKRKAEKGEGKKDLKGEADSRREQLEGDDEALVKNVVSPSAGLPRITRSRIGLRT
jgi:hypothetical protein